MNQNDIQQTTHKTEKVVSALSELNNLVFGMPGGTTSHMQVFRHWAQQAIKRCIAQRNN
jgi:molybdopterin biosynthesis enzyme